MANKILSRLLHDGSSGVVYFVTGFIDSDSEAVAQITDLAKLKFNPPQLRLDTILHSVEEGLLIRLWWHGVEDTLILPLGGRGVLDFDRFGGLTNPFDDGASGNVRLSVSRTIPKTRCFSLVLEFLKQGV